MNKGFVVKTTILSKKEEFSIQDIKTEVGKDISNDYIEKVLEELVSLGLVYDRGNKFLTKQKRLVYI